MGVAVTGWTIYKHIMEYQHNRSRRGIDSYMRDLLHIFNWAYEEELVDKRIMRKSDCYKSMSLHRLHLKYGLMKKSIISSIILNYLKSKRYNMVICYYWRTC